MARLHWIVLPNGLGSLSETWIMEVSGVPFAIEIFADKLPGFDVIWNTLHTFVRIPVAALLAYGVGNHLSPEMHVLVTCLDAAIAGVRMDRRRPCESQFYRVRSLCRISV